MRHYIHAEQPRQERNTPAASKFDIKPPEQASAHYFIHKLCQAQGPRAKFSPTTKFDLAHESVQRQS